MERKNEKILSEEIGWIVRGQEHREGMRLEVRSPFDQSLIGHVWQASRSGAEEAVEAAVAGFARTSALGSWERQNILNAVAAYLQAEHELYAQTILREAGKPITAARAEVESIERIVAQQTLGAGAEIVQIGCGRGWIEEKVSAARKIFQEISLGGCRSFLHSCNLFWATEFPQSRTLNFLQLKPVIAHCYVERLRQWAGSNSTGLAERQASKQGST